MDAFGEKAFGSALIIPKTNIEFVINNYISLRIHTILRIAMTSGTERTGREERHGTDDFEMTLVEALSQRARGLGDVPALIDGQSGRTHSYEKLADDVELIVERLAGRGFETGDDFVIYSPGLSEYVVASLAAATLGGASTLANPRATAKELTGTLDDTNAQYFVTVPPYFETAMAAVEGTTVEEILVFGDAVKKGERENGVTVTPLC